MLIKSGTINYLFRKISEDIIPNLQFLLQSATEKNTQIHY